MMISLLFFFHFDESKSLHTLHINSFVNVVSGCNNNGHRKRNEFFRNINGLNLNFFSPTFLFELMHSTFFVVDQGKMYSSKKNVWRRCDCKENLRFEKNFWLKSSRFYFCANFIQFTND